MRYRRLAAPAASGWLALGVALATLAPALARAPEQPPVANPIWVTTPDSYTLSFFYPDKAARMGKTGETTAACKVVSDGQLIDCKIVAETPIGLGFGPATIRAVRSCRVNTVDMDGHDITGGSVLASISWRLDGASRFVEPADEP